MDGITNGNHPPNMAKLYYQREKEFENTLKEREVGGGVPKTATPKQTKRTITAVINILVFKQDSDSARRTAKKIKKSITINQEMSPKGRQEANFNVFQVCLFFYCCFFLLFFPKCNWSSRDRPPADGPRRVKLQQIVPNPLKDRAERS